MAQITFKFDVTEQGVFTYQTAAPPPALQNWPFSAKDSLRFECPKGPFTLRLRRTDIAPGVGALPDIFGGPIQAQLIGGVWVAPVPVIVDGLTPQLRSTIFNANQFIAKYRYVIGVLNGAGVAVDDNHSGIHTC